MEEYLEGLSVILGRSLCIFFQHGVLALIRDVWATFVASKGLGTLGVTTLGGISQDASYVRFPCFPKWERGFL